MELCIVNGWIVLRVPAAIIEGHRMPYDVGIVYHPKPDENGGFAIRRRAEYNQAWDWAKEHAI